MRAPKTGKPDGKETAAHHAKQPAAAFGAGRQLDRLAGESNHALGRLLDNFAGKRASPAHTPALEAEPPATVSPGLARNLSPMPVHAPAAAILQSKLQVNTPGDAYEQEADRVAERVMRMPEPQLQRTGASGIESSGQRSTRAPAAGLQPRRVQASDAAGMAAPPAVSDALRSSGQPLDPLTRAFMEPRFGRDFGDVRIHSGPQADAAAASVQARAFTVGRDLVFAAGEHAPGSEGGKRLLAHELTHVIQQTGGHEVVQCDDAKVKHTTGKQVDTYLNANNFIKTYIEAKFKKGIKAEGHVHIDTEAEFVKAWVKYATGRENPDTKKAFTAEEAKNWASNINAFRDGTELHLHQDRGEPTTAIHESIHLFQEDTFASKVGFNAKEGTTEYFTRMICAEQKITREGFYASELKSIEKLVTVTTKETLAAAYFQGKVDDLEKAVEAKGKGTFAKWVGFMNGAKYSDANALL
jgi:hypothetical protein